MLVLGLGLDNHNPKCAVLCAHFYLNNICPTMNITRQVRYFGTEDYLYFVTICILGLGLDNHNYQSVQMVQSDIKCD